MLPLIAWDVDDVLNDLTREWLEWSGLPAPYAALLANPPHVELGITREWYLSSLDEFRRTRFEQLAPAEPVLKWLERSGQRARHIALTSTPLFAAPRSAAR